MNKAQSIINSALYFLSNNICHCEGALAFTRSNPHTLWRLLTALARGASVAPQVQEQRLATTKDKPYATYTLFN
jgi:hypothetical protein